MSSTANVLAVCLVFTASQGCLSPRNNGACSGDGCEQMPTFQGVLKPPADDDTSAAAMSAAGGVPVDPSSTSVSVMPSPVEQPPAAALDPLLEPPLTESELSELSDVDGLVVAEPWNGARSTLVTESKVMRSYLDWKRRFYRPCSDGSFYVLKTDVNLGDQVVSEGIGYGMLITVAVGDRSAFEGLWKHYRDRRNGNGLMNWRYDPCGGETGGNGASDADLDAAMGLVLADSRWGGYDEDARALIASIGTHETQTCNDGRTILKPGDAWGGCDDIVNPSYFSPGYYRRFADVESERAEFWNRFTQDTYSLLQSYQSQLNGLIPDWARADGSLVTDGRQVFGYEAVRGPWRVAIDYAWSGNDEARAFLVAMSENVDGRGGLATLADTDEFADKRNSAFLGTLSLPGIVGTQDKLDGYVRDWETYEKDDVWYYQATLRLLALLVAGGFFPVEY
jgi:endoglucanase